MTAMYLKPSHRPRHRAEMIELIRQNMFGTLVTNSAEGLMASHLPFVIADGEGDDATLYAHMARANPQSALLGSEPEVLVTFLGPHAYVSPSWYEDRATAPTWNYLAVHCSGRARVHSEVEAERNMERLVAVVEAGRPDPWSLADLTPHQIRGLLRNVVSFEVPVSRMEGKFKLNQGETPARNRAAIAHLEEEGHTGLASLMRQYNEV